MISLSYSTANVKSLTPLFLFTGTHAELFRFLLKSKCVTTDKMTAPYFTRGVINGKRDNENAEDIADILILDGDSRIDPLTGEIVAGAVNPHEVHLVLNHLNLDHLIYTSHSHSASVRKYRVLIPCQYNREQLPALLDWIFDRLHENEVMLANVKENSSWAQAWFMPSVHPERANLFKMFWRVNGKSSNPLRDDTEIEFLPTECFWVERIYSEWLSKQKSNVNHPITTLSQIPVTNLSANPIEAFNANFSVHDVLIRNGYKQQGKRYLHPNSASKVAGVRILDNGRAYSDSSDALNDGKAHDAFDCYRLLECGGDMRHALNWNSDITRANQRAFFEVPETEKPPQHYINGGFNKLLELPSVKGSNADNSQISNHETV